MASVSKSMTAKNKAFWKLSPAKQRVAVANDVLKHLSTGFYKAQTGNYLMFKKIKTEKEQIPEKLDNLLSELKSEGASCMVCGIGSILPAW